MFAYAIKSIIYLSLMYIPYMLLLRKESFFRFNRLMLLVIMVLSLVLPLVNIPAISWSGNAISHYLNPHVEIGIPFVVVDGEIGTAAEKSINWWQVAYCIYIIGVIITIAVKSIDLAILNKKIHRGVLWTDRNDGVSIYCHADDTAPFSWFGKIVISNNDYENNSTEILRHEMGHIKHGHSWDIVLLNIVQIIQWVNPLAWILGISLRDVHEYEADDTVLNSGVNIRQYQTLLIRKAIGIGSYSFANGFNHSLLTKRINMMLRKKSNPWMRTKGLYVIVVACIALSAFATPELNNKVNALVEKPSADKENISGAVPTAQKPPLKIDAAKQSDEKRVKNTFDLKGEKNVVVIIDGKECPASDVDKLNVNDIKSVSVLKDKEAIAVYGERGKDGVLIITTVNAEPNDKAFEVVEVMPQFPGGLSEMMSYVSRSVAYPHDAANMAIEGRVVVSFIVEKDGSLSDVKVVSENINSRKLKEDLKSAGNEKKLSEDEVNRAIEAVNKGEQQLRDEAMRVVREMPKWEPGKQKGKPVRVHYNIPISFRLQ
jgi:TonB-dependent SusC/RagA subfamily outer membrane receptor